MFIQTCTENGESEELRRTTEKGGEKRGRKTEKHPLFQGPENGPSAACEGERLEKAALAKSLPLSSIVLLLAFGFRC
jgi:hypothetical protein